MWPEGAVLIITVIDEVGNKIIQLASPLLSFLCSVVDVLFPIHDELLLDITNFPGDASGKEPAFHSRRHEKHGVNPWVRMIPWRRAWKPTPVFSLENPTDREAWQSTVHGVAKSQTWLKRLSTHSTHASLASQFGESGSWTVYTQHHMMLNGQYSIRF